eukprot:m.808054 g.808054  ORF g.808054 m.808054 type:complete len:87 (+) comp59309_c0_seq8:30-290(+)
MRIFLSFHRHSPSMWASCSPFPDTDVGSSCQAHFGPLNGGAHVDHVLQEDPLEIINEQLFSVRAHTSYWKSEDTILFLLNRIYTTD